MDQSRPQTIVAPAGAPAFPQPAYVPQNKVVSSRGWYNAKIVLGSLSLTTVVIILGLAGGLISNFPFADYAYIDLIIAYPPAVLAGIWQTAEFITLCVRRDRGIHPGAHVGLHLVIWLGTATSAGFLTTLTVYHSDCGSSCRRYNGFSSSSSSLYGQYLGLETALTAFVYILLVIHFTLFVRACIETNRRSAIGPTVVFVGGQPGVYYMPAAPQVMQYPVQPQIPAASYAPVPSQQQAAHNSMYGFYAPPQPEHSGYPQTKVELPHSPSPPEPSAATPVSSVVTSDRHNVA